MARKPYSPLAEYSELKRVENLLQQAQTIDEVRKVCAADGPKVGYKAFCYLFTGRMSAEAMKPDEACTAAAALEQEGKAGEAQAIYQKVLAVHPDHPLAKDKINQ